MRDHSWSLVRRDLIRSSTWECRRCGSRTQSRSRPVTHGSVILIWTRSYACVNVEEAVRQGLAVSTRIPSDCDEVVTAFVMGSRRPEVARAPPYRSTWETRRPI